MPIRQINGNCFQNNGISLITFLLFRQNKSYIEKTYRNIINNQ